MIPDPSTLTNQYQMMQPPQMDNNKPPSNGLPNLQLPGLPRPPNLPQNDGACDLEDMTTEVNHLFVGIHCTQLICPLYIANRCTY
jgi:hypothetical protein